MKTKKTCLINRGIIFFAIFTAVRVGVCSDSQEKEWVVFQERIPENSIRYSVTLKYSPSEAALYSANRSNIKSTALPEGERTDDYTERIDLGAAIDGYQYSLLLRGAYELALLNSDERQITSHFIT